MGILLLPHDEQLSFDAADLTLLLHDIEGVKDIKEVHDDFVDLQWSVADEREAATCSLQSGGDAITVDPENRRAVLFAFMLAKKLPFAVDLINDEYTYQLDLTAFGSAEEAWKAVNAAYERATDGPEPYRG